MSKELIQKLNEAASKIASASTKGLSACFFKDRFIGSDHRGNYIITSKSIGDILRRQFYRTDRIVKIEKILKKI
jgi:hypothetical protein